MKKFTLLFRFLIFLIAVQGFSQTDISDLLERYNKHNAITGSVTDFFTIEELLQLRVHFASNTLPEDASQRIGDATAFGFDEMSSEFGWYNVSEPTPFTLIDEVPDLENFQGGGAVDPADRSTAIVLESFGKAWSVDLATGVYEFLGDLINFSGQITGLEFSPVDGTLYMMTLENLYTVDLTTLEATLIGPHSIEFAIALAIDDTGTGYAYNIVIETFYSIDLSTGASTEIGPIGFSANFGQGMFWDSDAGVMYMTCFNDGVFNGQLRTVNLVTGSTTLIGEWAFGLPQTVQVAWSGIGNEPPLSVDDNILAQVILSPNPTSDILNITLPMDVQIESLKLFDLQGRNVNVETVFRATNGQIKVSNLSRGMYILNLKTSVGTITKKVVKR